MKSAVTLLTAALVLAMGVALCDTVHAQGAAHTTRVITLMADEITHLGIATVPAERTVYTPEVRGYGVVISLASIAEIDFEYRTSEAAVTDSQAALQRAQRLFALQALSQAAIDTAKHQAAADMAQFVLADRKEAASFGENAPWRGPPRNEALLDTIASGSATLVEATFPLGIAFAAPPKSLIVTRLDPQPGQPRWAARYIWAAPANPEIPGRNFFALVDRADLALGEHAVVFAPVGAPITGVRIPADALVLSEDKPWCYVALSQNSFRRVPIDLGLQQGDGYFVPKGIAPGTPVVVKGTGLLLARELGPATPGAD